MEKVVPSQPYFISNFLSSGRSFWIGQSWKEFEFHFNPFEFEFRIKSSPLPGTVAPGLTCCDPFPPPPL
jgi:hypothetical protein